MYWFALAIYKTYKEVVGPFWIRSIEENRPVFKGPFDAVPKYRQFLNLSGVIATEYFEWDKSVKAKLVQFDITVIYDLILASS